jgi:hypothetical protein
MSLIAFQASDRSNQFLIRVHLTGRPSKGRQIGAIGNADKSIGRQVQLLAPESDLELSESD